MFELLTKDTRRAVRRDAENLRRAIAEARTATQTGGILLRGVQTHRDRRNPPAKQLRQDFQNRLNRGIFD